MTQEDIQALDGPALCTLAWQLGLAPADVVGDREVDHAHLGQAPCRWVLDHWEPWVPQNCIDTASAVFRSLRVLGWTSQTSYNPWTHCGSVRVCHLATAEAGGTELPWILCLFAPGGDSEPLALLRCACLAVASMEDEK